MGSLADLGIISGVQVSSLSDTPTYQQQNTAVISIGVPSLDNGQIITPVDYNSSQLIATNHLLLGLTSTFGSLAGILIIVILFSLYRLRTPIFYYLNHFRFGFTNLDVGLDIKCAVRLDGIVISEQLWRLRGGLNMNDLTETIVINELETPSQVSISHQEIDMTDSNHDFHDCI